MKPQNKKLGHDRNAWCTCMRGKCRPIKLQHSNESNFTEKLIDKTYFNVEFRVHILYGIIR